MKRHLGYPVDDAESRTIGNKVPKNKDPVIEPTDVAGGGTNSSSTGTPNVVSDMGMNLENIIYEK